MCSLTQNHAVQVFLSKLIPDHQADPLKPLFDKFILTENHLIRKADSSVENQVDLGRRIPLQYALSWEAISEKDGCIVYLDNATTPPPPLSCTCGHLLYQPMVALL